MHFTKHYHFIAASIIGAILLTLSWQPYGLVFPVFFGFVPLLWLEYQLRMQNKNGLWVFAYGYLTFLLWNLGTTWWVWNASAEGAMMAFILNSLLMSLPFMLYHRFQSRMPVQQAQQVFIFLWIAFEYAHYNWEGTYPWLSLGNVFSSMPGMVQWYEYTGVIGGTIWVLFVNIRIFRYLLEWNNRSVMMRYSKGLNLLFFYVFAPIFLSWYIESDVKIHGKNLQVVVVQPNIDPYNQKFDGMTPVEQTRKMLSLAERAIDSTTQLVCFPETAIVGSLNEEELLNNTSVLLIKQFLYAHPQLVVLTGADTYRFYKDGNYTSPTAREYNKELFYDAYNTALLIDQTDNIQIYHKSKLVPGVERLPYANSIGFIKQLTIDLGGTSGSLGFDPFSKSFYINKKVLGDLKVAPVICYESVFGEYVGTYIQQGANLIGIITNDGWWGNTPGYKQHFDYARLRAIETRRYVARSANTGISGFIDPKGNVISKSEWWQEAVLKETVILNTDETFYVMYGDFLGKTGLMLSVLYLLLKRRKIAEFK